MGLGTLVEERKNNPKTKEVTEVEGEKYPRKMQPKPDPEEFGYYRSSGHAVGPELTEIGGIQSLVDRMKRCTSIHDWSLLLSDYIKWGNNTKVSKYVGIFNISAAVDCPNRGTEHCQVGENECYSVRDEKRYPYALDYYRRQECLWDSLDAETWAKAFIQLVGRRRTETKALKFNQSGDFRHDGDILKVDRIAEMLSEHNIYVFTYSASDYLDWSHAEHFTVNQSNDRSNYGDRRYKVLEHHETIPDDAVHCVYDEERMQGISPDKSTKCGECMLCINEDAPDVVVRKKT